MLITLKLFRFEVGAALVLALLATAGGIWILVQLGTLNVPDHCIEGWLISGPEGRPQCTQPMRAWIAVMAPQSETFFWAMTALPFVAGILAGVPLVARELETQTAQISWWLHSSRIHWLIRRVVPIAVPVVVGLSIAAAVATPIADLEVASGRPAMAYLGAQGPLVVARGCAAFALGVFVGALVGNTLRSLVLSAAVSLALFVGFHQLQTVWLQSLPRQVIGEVSQSTGEAEVVPGAITTGWGWRGPNGEITSDEREGYEPVQLGVLQETAIGWEGNELALYSLVAVGTLVGTAAIVRSRRPG